MSIENQSQVVPLLVSVRDTAMLLGISAKTIRNQSCAGKFKLTPVRIGGRQLFRMSDIMELVYGPSMLPSVRNFQQDAAPPIVTPQVKRGRGRPSKSASLQQGGAA